MGAQCSLFQHTGVSRLEHKYVTFPQCLKQNIYIYEDINSLSQVPDIC